jgi:diguanylate cyclase (GGDEF)-like protein
MLCADGLEIWTNCHIVLQQAPDGDPLYCIMQIADITEMKTSQRKMERLAFYDTLTELANRRLFNDRLQQAVEHCRRHRQRAALLYLDLDQFKRVNDTLGHEAGDALLREVADRLLNCVRKEDTVGRPGGDEFTILLYDVDEPDHAGQVAEKILRTLQQPISLSGHQLVVTTSIGITVIPDDGVDPAALLKNADLAMYRAKEKGRNNYQFYSEELNTNAVRRLRTEYELRRALERSEFELHFQPVVRLTDQSIVGVECLLRWNHPERGPVPPDDFISIAEDTGAIVEIGNWVIEEACAAGRLMTEQRGAPVSIAVNISPRQFRDPELVSTIRHSLRRARLEPACLELEITETMLMGDVEAASEIVRRLHKLGIRLAIDDFGTGYSSLNYLKKFPISTVKVDRSFVADIPESSDDMEITAAVIAMAHRLKMQVVAEGVETQAQLDFLAEQDCDFAQGYLFSHALPLQDIRPMLGSNVRLLRGQGS